MNDHLSIIQALKAMANPEVVLYREQKFGVVSQNALGISLKQLNELCKQIQASKSLALKLFDTDIYEAKLLCAKLLKPKEVTIDMANAWVGHFDNWEICDVFCLGLFAKSEWAAQQIRVWALSEETFIRRAAFATLAGHCMADKTANNEHFSSFFPLIKTHANDDRLYVKKAISWALRSIGKRNRDLLALSLECSDQLLQMDAKSAQWIAKDAIRELSQPKVRISDYPRSIYRP